MTAITPEWVPGDVRLTTAGTELLTAFNCAGVLAVPDVHVAMTLGRLGGEHDETVLLATALAVRALRLGSVCVDLRTVAERVAGDAEQLLDTSGLPWPATEPWLDACRRSPLVADPELDGGRPLRFDHDLLYLDRYWREERAIAAGLMARAELVGGVDETRLRDSLARWFTGPAPDLQRVAVAVAALRTSSVLAGGPGTGKTFTVARLLAVLRDQDPARPPRVVLTAPTGKAAARLREAVHTEAAAMAGVDPAVADWLPRLEAGTLHRTLGWSGPDRPYRHNRRNHLPADVVVVDETSMVSLSMMARLLEALRPSARLVLVGDPDQLASVEAGAVLGDVARAEGPPEPELTAALRRVTAGDLDPVVEPVVEPVVDESTVDRTDVGDLRNGVVTLTVRHRFGGRIASLAEAVRAGDADATLSVLRDGSDPAVEFVELDVAEIGIGAAPLTGLFTDLIDSAQAMTAAAEVGDAAAALTQLQRHRLLCGHRRGPYGVQRWADEIRWRLGVPEREEYFIGRPVLVNRNDYDLNLYNGDTGVVIGGAGRRLLVAFETVTVPAVRLGDVESVYAMTVHRAQGSQFDSVSVLLPPADSPLATRELFYTALTRARRRVRVIGTEDAVRAAVGRPVNRASGLRSLVPPSA